VLFLVDNSLSGNRIGDMPTQSTLNLVTKLPSSEVPRIQHNGTECLNQKALQVEGNFKRGDAHPHYEGIYYKGIKTKETQAWWTAEMAERGKKSDNQYYKDNWEKLKKYRDSRKEERSTYHNKYYETKKAYYRSRNTRRRASLKENIKLNKVQKKVLDEIHDLRMELDLAAVGAGEFPKGYNKKDRWSFEVHHIMPVLANKDSYCGLDAPWNVEILSVADHKKAHSYASPSEY